MTKRKAAFDPRQTAFTFDPPTTMEGGLAGFDRVVASAVSRILKEDPRSRFEIAGGVSGLLDDDVSKPMLDAYSAEAKDAHNISLARFLALVCETQRFDVLDALCQRIGCKIVVGEEILTVELGHLQAQMDRLARRMKAVRATAPEITRGGRSK